MGLVFLSNVLVWTFSAAEVMVWMQLNYSITEDKKAILSSYVNESSWFKVRLLYLALSLSVIIFGRFYKKTINDVMSSLLCFVQLVMHEVSFLNRREKLLVGGIGFLFFLALIWYSSHVYVQLDELNSWLYFVNRGALVTIAYYPSSNNHIGYNVVSMFWNHFFQPVLAIRLTSMLSALGVICLLYVILVKRYHALLASLAILIVMCLAPFVWYAIQGRGYVLEVFVLLLLVFLVVHKSDKKFDWSFVFVSVFALYIVPVALIPVGLLVLTYLYVMRYDLAFVKRATLVILSTVGLSVLVYAPVWIFSNAQLLFSNSLVKQVSWGEAPLTLATNYYPSLWMFITGTVGLPSILLAVSMILLSAWMMVMKRYLVLIPFMIVIVLPSLLFLVYPVLLYERTWIWLIVKMIWWLLELFVFLKASNRFVFYAFVLGFFGLVIYSNSYKLYAVQQGAWVMEMQLNELRAPICESGKRLKIDDDVLYTYFRYYERECFFLVESGVKQSEKGEWVLVPAAQFSGEEGEVICENSMGVLYKSN